MPTINNLESSTAQHSTAQHSTAQHSTAQHSTAQLNLLHDILTKQLKAKQITRIALYNNELVYIDIQVNQLYFALDITLENQIFLVSRYSECQQFLSHLLGFPLARRIKISDGEGCCFPELFPKDTFFHTNLIQQVEQIIQRIINLCTSDSATLVRIQQKVDQLYDSVRFETQNRVWDDMQRFLKPRQLSIPETLRKIRDEELSMARFGDGEVRCMMSRGGCVFQKHEWRLMQELRDICSQPQRNLLVCFPHPIEIDWWHRFWSEFWFQTKYYINNERLGDSMVTRMEAFYLFDQEVVQLWHEILQDKRVCFISGENSRLKPNHHIFSTIASWSKISSKNSDAYSDIDNIMEQCISKQNEVDMFLIALGPTGTVLSGRLAKLGLRALDIGHLNNSYDTVYLGRGTPETLPISE